MMRSALITVLWSLFARWILVSAQNLTDEQLAVVGQRLAESAQESWELGTRTETILEVNATLYSVFSRTTINPPSSPPENLTTALQPFFDIARMVVADWANSTNGTVGPQPLAPGNGSAGDPASIGVSVLLANWTGNGDGSALDFAGAAKDELEFLFTVPKTSDGAISHRVSEVQLWSDFVYMVPPFLAYYGVLSENRTLLVDAYTQIQLYRNYLCDPNAQNRWKHVLLGQSEPNDEGHWTTGNGWAAAGILRVLATIRNSQYANTMKDEQEDLANWVEEIHDGMYAVLNSSVNLWTNYPDIPPTTSGNFYDASGTALLASTVFRGAVMLNQFTHVRAAERVMKTLFSSSSSSSSSSPFENYTYFTSDGWLTPVVNPHSYGQEGSQSPESEAFVLQLHSAWKDWVADGSPGGNGAMRRMGGNGWMWFLQGFWLWFVGGGILGILI